MQRQSKSSRRMIVAALTLGLAALIGGGATWSRGEQARATPEVPVLADPGGTGGSNGG